jgi:hypothetical protein
MEPTCSSETSVDFPQTSLRYIPKYRSLYNHSYEDLKLYISNFVSENTNLLVTGGGVSYVILEHSDQKNFEGSFGSRTQEEDIKGLLVALCLMSSECSLSVGTAKSTSYYTHFTTLLPMCLH